jgi:hypothetical protein
MVMMKVDLRFFARLNHIPMLRFLPKFFRFFRFVGKIRDVCQWFVFPIYHTNFIETEKRRTFEMTWAKTGCTQAAGSEEPF